MDFFKATTIPIRFLFFMWLIFALEYIFKIDLKYLALHPRHIEGLLGIIFSPVLHASPGHISSNSLPFFVLTTLLFMIYPILAQQVFFILYLGSGALLWMVGRDFYHIGMSGMIYSLAGFIILIGFLKNKIKTIFISIVLILFYSYLGYGLIPAFIRSQNEFVSIEAHWSGLIVGIITAIKYYRK